MKEKLSAFIDGELTEFEARRVVRELEKDGELRRSFGRYHLIRAALRAQRDQSPMINLADRVREQVGNLSKESKASHAGSWPRRLGQLAGTVALAASVAVVTLYGLQGLLNPATDPVGPLADAGKAAAPVVRANTVRWAQQKPETESVLNTYLVEHNEFAPTNGMSGMLLPYVRVVAYDRNP